MNLEYCVINVYNIMIFSNFIYLHYFYLFIIPDIILFFIYILNRNFISVSLLISFIWDEISKYLHFFFFFFFFLCVCVCEEKIKIELLISIRNLIQNLYNFQGYSFSFFLSFLSFFLSFLYIIKHILRF